MRCSSLILASPLNPTYNNYQCGLGNRSRVVLSNDFHRLISYRNRVFKKKLGFKNQILFSLSASTKRLRVSIFYLTITVLGKNSVSIHDGGIITFQSAIYTHFTFWRRFFSFFRHLLGFRAGDYWVQALLHENRSP